jgi:hypothetical protein
MRAGRLTLEPGRPVDVAIPGPHATSVGLIRPVDGDTVYLRADEDPETAGRGIPLSAERYVMSWEVGTNRQLWLEADGDRPAQVDVLVEG